MGILVECPKCKARGSTTRKVCKCGYQVQKSNSKNYWSLLSWFILIVSIAVLVSSCSSSEDISPETTAPVIAEVTFVTTPTNDSTPNYTFSSDEAGTITYGGSCSSSTTSASSGNNTITLVALNDDTYSNCSIIVTDSAGNVSNTLTITSFTVDTTDNTTSSSTTAVFGTSRFNSSYFGE